MNISVLRFVHSCNTVLTLTLLSSSVAASALAAQEAEDVKAVLVTGTSSGIGLRITEALAQNGFLVYAGARKAEDLERLDAMDNVKAVRLDVTIQSEIDAVVALVEAEGRGLYGLVNNAGVSVMGPLIELPEEDMDFLFDVNLYGPYRVTKAFADLLIESGGRVVTVSSIAGIVSGPFSGPYTMSKHGVEAYTDALAAELAGFNVAVAAVEPGNYKSQILVSMVERMKAKGYSAEGSRYGSMLDLITGPLDRSQYREPDDVALAVLDFLSSDTPRHRYMVVPNQAEAGLTITQALREVVQLNQGHAFSYSRDELIEILDEVLAQEQASLSRSTASQAGLHQAALEGNLPAIRQHVEAGADPDEKDAYGSTPLIIAATFGHEEVAQALIEAGADLDQQNRDGATALFTAALLCRTQIAQALLDNGADRSIRNNAGSTPLDVVSMPWDEIEQVYDYLGSILKPFGLELDYERIKETRPVIAEMLRR